MKTNEGREIEFTDKHGERRILHGTRHGFRVKQGKTPVLEMNRTIGRLLGQRIKTARTLRGMSLRELAEASGLIYSNPKTAIHAIEANTRNEGIRLGTLYAIARGLEIDPRELLPPLDNVIAESGVKVVKKVHLVIENGGS